MIDSTILGQTTHMQSVVDFGCEVKEYCERWRTGDVVFERPGECKSCGCVGRMIGHGYYIRKVFIHPPNKKIAELGQNRSSLSTNMLVTATNTTGSSMYPKTNILKKGFFVPGETGEVGVCLLRPASLSAALRPTISVPNPQAMLLSHHDLKQINPDYLKSLPPGKLLEVSVKLLQDLQ